MLLFEALARLGGAFGAGRLRRRPRFARQGLATLGLAKLRKWLSSAGACLYVFSKKELAFGRPSESVTFL